MDFNDSPEEARYRAEIAAWIAANAPPRSSGLDRTMTAERLAQAKAWQGRKAAAGYGAIAWPKEWGGAGGSALQQVIFSEEEARLGIDTSPFIIGLGMCIPTVLTAGAAADKERFAAPAIRGEEIWCQLFSEPAAGSDIAGLRTRAVRDGDDWVINGQKVWTSGAHYSDFGLLLVRTDPEVPKHKGLTMFWVDMRAPGIEIRPIHQMSGDAEFNEVYFTDVRVSDAQRIGPVGQGWQVSLVTLMNERLAVGSSIEFDTAEIIELAQGLAATEHGGALLDDAAFRERLADWHVQAAGVKYTRYRTVTALSRGQTPGPESSIGKLVSANLGQDIHSFGVELQEQFGLLADPAQALLEGRFQKSFLQAPGMRLAGGTDEILKNVIAERVLGLPGDIRVDKDVAFKDIPTGGR